MTDTKPLHGAIRVAVLGSMAMSLSLLTGCLSLSQDPTEGYSTAPLHDPKIKTVFVEMFKRHKAEFRRGYEFRLTEALAKQISSATDLRIAGKSTADTILSGEILEVDFNVLSEVGADVTREIQISIKVAVRWQNVRSGEIVMELAELKVAGEYIPRLGEDEFRGSQVAVEKLARRIVEKMESQW